MWLFPGCKIIQTVGEGGNIVSRTGENHCTGQHTCTIDVEDGEEFSDTFTAVASPGYRFVGWRKQHKYLCGGKTMPCALVGIPGELTRENVKLNLEAVFERNEPAVEGACTGVEVELPQGEPYEDWIGRPVKIYRKIAYGDHERQVLDLFLHDDEETRGMAVYFHSGEGDRSEAYEATAISMLSRNIAFATVDYPLASTPGNDLLTMFHGAARSLQFLRCHARQLRMLPNRIGVMGASQGSGIAMLLGFRDDGADRDSDDPVQRMSTRAQVISGGGVQATWDIERWEEVLQLALEAYVDSGQIASTELEDWVGINHGLGSLYQSFNIGSLEEFYTPELEALRAGVDFLAHMDAADAPFCLSNETDPVDLADITTFDQRHDGLHAMALKERANAVGLESTVWARGSFVDYVDEDYADYDDSCYSFVARHLK